MPFYAFNRGLQSPLRFDTRAAFERFVDGLRDVEKWWFSAKVDVKERLAAVLAEQLRRRRCNGES